MDSIPGRVIPKMVLVATLLGAQHYKASTGFSSPPKSCKYDNLNDRNTVNMLRRWLVAGILVLSLGSGDGNTLTRG